MPRLRLGSDAIRRAVQYFHASQYRTGVLNLNSEWTVTDTLGDGTWRNKTFATEAEIDAEFVAWLTRAYTQAGRAKAPSTPG